MHETQNWRRCSFCKKEIPFASKYYVCSVSTCRQKRTGLVFCSSSCWDGHDGETRHRESWAEETMAPTRNAWLAEQASVAQLGAPPSTQNSVQKTAPHTAMKTVTPSNKAESAPSVILRKSPQNLTTSTASSHTPPQTLTKNLPREILIVASKLKTYIKARAEMNTSDACCEILSEELRRLSERAIARAREHSRKTVLERDFDTPPPPIDDPTLPRDTLVVVSKLKHYIRKSSEMNTADAVKDILSDFLRARSEAAIRNARQASRKTVLDRDFQ